MTAPLIIIGLCLLFEAFFSGSEIALLSADKIKLRHRSESIGGRKGRLLASFLDDPSTLISTSLIGTNICVVLSTVLATLTFLEHYPDHAELLSLTVMTPLVLIVGEIVPKSLFQRYADQAVARCIYILDGFRLAFYPVVLVGARLSQALIALFRLEQGSRALLNRDELRLLVRLPSREGKDRISADERRMVTRLFDVKQTTVLDVMLPLSEVTALPDTAALEELAQEIADKQHTRIPIYRERLDQIIGVVHAFDLLRAKPDERPCEICRPAIFVPESQPVMQTLMRLQREGQGMAVVVDEYGGATGVITIEDILEEIVGDIDDEYDRKERAMIRRESDGSFLVEGRIRIDRLNEALHLALPEGDDYESLAGLILDRLKRLPAPGEELMVNGTRLSIVAASERSIDRVRMRPGRKAAAKKGSSA